jgi:hypothetical protein
MRNAMGAAGESKTKTTTSSGVIPEMPKALSGIFQSLKTPDKRKRFPG